MASACQFLRIPALPWCVKPGPDLKYGYMQEETRLLYYSVGVATKTHCQGSDRVLHKLCCALLLDLPVVFSAASFASLDLCLLKWYLPGNSLEDVKAWAWASMGIWTLGLLRTRCSHRPAGFVSGESSLGRNAEHRRSICSATPIMPACDSVQDSGGLAVPAS